MQHYSQTDSFSGIRSYLWPIHANELRKLVPMLFMNFLVCFNYTILRNLKDALIITAKNSGAEVIPFIKVWGILPAAIAATMLFSYLSNHLSRVRVFQIIVSSFLLFFLSFFLFIYPNRDALHPHATADLLESILPVGFKGLISMFRNWTFTGFYIVSELWASLVLNVLLWGFNNEVTKLSEVSRFYGVISIAANAAVVCASQTAVALTTNVYNPSLLFGHDAWEQSIIKLLLLVITSGIIVLFIFRWMNDKVLSDPKNLPEEMSSASYKKEKKLSFRESLVYLAHSKYLLSIAAIVISYNLVFNLVEIIWKDRLREFCPSPHDYNIYVNQWSSALGIMSTLISLSMVFILRKLGWTKVALLTPIILLGTTICFFISFFSQFHLAGYLYAFLGTTPLATTVFFGGMHNSVSRAAKYSLFDTTTNMAFVPLTPEHKLKGKAAIDGIGSRLGKSGSSVIHQSLLLLFGTISASAPYVAIILIGVIGLWIIAVTNLGKEFRCFTESGHGEEIKETKAAVSA